MKMTLLALSGLLAVASFCACNNDDNEDMSQMLNATDSSYVLMAGMGNTAEISTSQLALTRSIDTAVLNFANQMIADHTAAQARLKSIAAPYGVTPPDSVDAAHAQIAAMLASMSGRAFDSMYIHQQVVDHQAAIQLYTTESNAGNNVNLTNFADTTLPKLQMHLDHANMIAAGY